ncbi:NAD(P)-binding protein [Peniophora sp. CONT]|nr:NAD(P)-binding protein [Peniophora sp. CONT]
MALDFSECELFTFRHDVYPLIDPQPAFASQSYKGQVVIVTGGSSGIGFATALMYARAGARIVINARNASKLEVKKAEIQDKVTGAEVVAVSGDVSEVEVGKKIVKAAVDAWGRVDIVIANSAVLMGGARFHELDAVKWWYSQEVNVRGVLNVIHAAIPELLKTKGQIIVSTSDLAHARIPLLADMSISKHTTNRFVEILALDYASQITLYSVHPGEIMTEGADIVQTGLGIKGQVPMPDTVELPAATYLWLTGRNAEFLNGRYVQATWDLGEVLAKKEEIVKENLLVTKLAGPNLKPKSV